MILATHAIVGAAAGRLFENPFLAFFAGYFTHFLLDAIPHSQYALSSRTHIKEDRLAENIVLDRRFLGDLVLIGLDCIGGFLLALLIFQGGLGYNAYTLSLLLGAVGGVFPDFMQFIYFKIKHEPFITLQRFHNWAHAKGDLYGFTGVASQVTIIILAVMMSKLIMR